RQVCPSLVGVAAVGGRERAARNARLMAGGIVRPVVAVRLARSDVQIGDNAVSPARAERLDIGGAEVGGRRIDVDVDDAERARDLRKINARRGAVERDPRAALREAAPSPRDFARAGTGGDGPWTHAEVPGAGDGPQDKEKRPFGPSS